MSNNGGLPAQARIVTVGGGIIGCSTAYHLAREKIEGVSPDLPTLRDPDQLTCFTEFRLSSAAIPRGWQEVD